MAASEAHFRVMASGASVVIVDPVGADELTFAEQRLRQIEARWSRFDPGSELNHLARAGGEWLEVSTDTATIIETMQRASIETGGWYDPTMMFEIIAAGYDRSIVDRSVCGVAVDAPSIGLTVLDAELARDGERLWARLPAGLALDPGGIGKGLAADLVLGDLLARGNSGALVEVGGDLAAAGTPSSPDGWPVVVVAHAGEPEEADSDWDYAAFTFSGGGVATSSTRSRTWTQRRRRRHHVLDPTRRAESNTDLTSATVIADSGWRAEVHATAALLAGRDGWRQSLQNHGLQGLVVADDDTVAGTEAFEPGTAGAGR